MFEIILEFSIIILLFNVLVVIFMFTAKRVNMLIKNKFVDGLKDDKIKVLSAWLQMNRELGTTFTKNKVNTQLYNIDSSAVKLSETAKVELANAISAFIMNI